MIEGIENPHQMRLSMPALYQEDDFTNRFVSAFDEVLATVLQTLDCLDAYLDPALAPMDFVTWLAQWVGLELDENWSDEQQRRLVGGTSAELGSWRGTVRGLVDLLRIYTGLPADAIEVLDNGGVSYSQTAGSPLPGEAVPTLTVRIRAGDGSDVDVTRVERLVAAAKPAHVPHEVEVVGA